MLSALLLSTSFFIAGCTETCNRCWLPYIPVILYSLGGSLISPSVNPSIPLIAGKEHLAFAFSIYRAFGAISTGLWVMIIGIVQKETIEVKEGYYWVALTLIVEFVVIGKCRIISVC